MINKTQGIIIQVVGITATCFGICLEIYYKADIYFTVITAGSLLFAVGTKLKYADKQK